MKCKCGFEFSKPGEFRNCEVFITSNNETIYVCPICGEKYVGRD